MQSVLPKNLPRFSTTRGAGLVQIYSAVSTVLGRQSSAYRRFGASIVDTVICAKPGKVLAGQLLYGDSIHRTYFVLT